MSIILSLSSLALRQVVEGAWAAVGITAGGEAVATFLTERFTDHSNRLNDALQNANAKAWTALEIALVGDSFWERCKGLVARTEDKAFGQQVRAFLDATPLPELAGKVAFRQKCLEELRAARKGPALRGGTLNPRQLAQETADFAKFAEPTQLLDAEWRMVVGLASQVKEAGFHNLAWLLAQRPREGTPILVAGVRYFFRRAVEEDPKLFQGLSFAKLEALGESQERGFASLSAALAQQEQRLEELLGNVQAAAIQTHSAVLDLQDQMTGQSEQIGQIGQAVMKLLEQHHLGHREVRPGDSLSIRTNGERQLVKQLVSRYRSLPLGDRQNIPALLNAIGKLEVVAGDFDQAQKDFQAVAALVNDGKSKAEAHFNAYQTALERHDFDAALKEFLEAVKLDGKRYALFPVDKYQPLRILGAGGFGTAFLCRHQYMNAEVVVKTLDLDALGRETDKVFTEAQLLRQLDHPAIIRISECGYVDGVSKGRPHIIMDYFPGQTLEGYVKEYGPLASADLLPVARQIAEGLQAAHGAKILHRDVKPANLLVRKEADGWQVKVIDFGLALPQKVTQTSQNTSTAEQRRTMIGSSIAGTLDYGAPEQMGRRQEPVGPYSDVYGWAKTCLYALFQTTQPLMKHWQSIPPALAQLLEECLDEDPKKRPGSFKEVLTGLKTLPGEMKQGKAVWAVPVKEILPAHPLPQPQKRIPDSPPCRRTWTVTCTNCATTLRAPDTSAGKKVKCPKCATILSVPSSDEVLEEVPMQVKVLPPARRPAKAPDDDAPRRRDQNDDKPSEDDAPRRRSWRQPVEATGGGGGAQIGLGIMSLSVGIVGLLLSFIPCLGLCISAPFAMIGFLLGALGLIIAMTQRGRSIAFPAVGTIVSLAGGIVPWMISAGTLLNQTGSELKKGAEALEQAKKKQQADQLLKDNTARDKSKDNLKQLALAMHKFAEVNAGLLPKAINTKLSWRVALLPYLEQGELCNRFRQEEPWNSPHNRALANLMPDVYKPVRNNPGGNRTYYQVITGNLGPFGGPNPPRFPAAFQRGTANTILIVEGGNAVEWTNPQDIVYNGQIPYVPGQPVPRLGGVYDNGFFAAMGDARVLFFEQARYNDSKIHSLITPNDLEIVELPQP